MLKKYSGHHSIVDWDFQYGDTYRSLSTDHFITPPTSLQFVTPSTTAIQESVLCRDAATLCLPQGEFRTWLWEYYLGGWFCIFRNQAALGTANHQNCYVLVRGSPNGIFGRMVNNVWTQMSTFPLPENWNQWLHLRARWWIGETGEGVPAMLLKVYYQNGGGWVQTGGTIYDTANRWAESGVNRVGFRSFIHHNKAEWWEDTEIWAPV